MSRSSSARLLARSGRSLRPEECPCYDLEGVYKYTPGCRGRCCFTAGTPEGEDSPKWKETLAVR